jgi:hypothetical protein
VGVRCTAGKSRPPSKRTSASASRARGGSNGNLSSDPQASLTVPRSPSSSAAVIESHGICIFWNHVAKERSSGACIMHTIFPSDRLRKLRYGCTIGSFWAACAIWLICSRVRAPAGTVWLLMNLGIAFVLSGLIYWRRGSVWMRIRGRPDLRQARKSYRAGKISSFRAGRPQQQ